MLLRRSALPLAVAVVVTVVVSGARVKTPTDEVFVVPSASCSRLRVGFVPRKIAREFYFPLTDSAAHAVCTTVLRGEEVVARMWALCRFSQTRSLLRGGRAGRALRLCCFCLFLTCA